MRSVKPMLASSGKQDDLARIGYIFEPKLDGIRALCHVNKAVTFTSRNMLTITAQYPEFAIRDYIKAKTAILDGEIIMYDAQGKPSFSALQRRAFEHEKHLRHKHATYVVFDILMKDGIWLTDLPLHARKKILAQTVRTKKGLIERVVTTPDGKKLWRIARKFKLEGVIAKQKDSIYCPGKRTREWIKIKKIHTADCVIIGFTQEKRLISSLALGVYNHGILTYIGKVGTGFNEQNIAELYPKLKKIVRQTAPCPCPLKTAIFVRPFYVCEVEFLEWTRDKRLRAPVFVRIRSDKKSKECTFNQ